MNLLYSYCEKGKGEFNEDVMLYKSKIACVIDGATDVFFDKHKELENIVYVYVNNLIKKIESCFTDKKSLKEILKEAISLSTKSIGKKYNLNSYKEYELPTFSIACIKENKGDYEYLVLGDCFIAIKIDDNVKFIEDNRISHFSKLNRENIKKEALDPRIDASAIDIYRQTRKKANSKNGYPIGSVSAIGIKDALYGKIPKKENLKILLFSDGFIDYFKEKKINYEDAFDKDCLEGFVEDSLSYYLDNDSYIENLRPKQLDDRTILLLEGEEEEWFLKKIFAVMSI